MQMFEPGILQAVTDARATALSAVGPEMRLEAEGQLGQTITSLITVAEQYPELAANSHFRDLRIELTDIENRITASRRAISSAVDYKTLDQALTKYVNQRKSLLDGDVC